MEIEMCNEQNPKQRNKEEKQTSKHFNMYNLWMYPLNNESNKGQ